MRLGIAAALVLMVFGCGTLEGPRTGTISPPADALSRWSTFPADQNPRPIVLIANYSPGQAFDAHDGKIAALCSKFALSAPLPLDAPKQAVASWPDGTMETYPGISATDAFTVMTRPGSGASGPQCAKVAPLPVTAARLAMAAFTTDRGVAKMSAWLFKVAGASAEFIYPAITPSAFWTGGLVDGSIGGGASVSASGRQLAFSFIGGPPDGQCAVDYVGVAAESPHAVAVAVQSNPGRPKAGPVPCDLIGHLRSVTVQLATPLGGRVLLDASGVPVEACPEAIRSGCF